MVSLTYLLSLFLPLSPPHFLPCTYQPDCLPSILCTCSTASWSGHCCQCAIMAVTITIVLFWDNDWTQNLLRTLWHHSNHHSVNLQHLIYMYTVYAEIFANFAICSHWRNFYCANFLSCVNDYIEDIVTFTALAKNYSTKYFCNTKVAGLGEIFVKRNFHVYGN